MKAHLRLFGVPVRVDPSFLLLVGFFGYLLFLRGDDPHALTMFAIWIPLVTVAILAHELGHALLGRRFGLTPFVVLHAMGGLTTFPLAPHRALSHGRRILIVLAGPGAGIAVGAVAMGIAWGSGLPEGSIGSRALDTLFWVTAGWGVLNLAPILPLDGGQVVLTVLDRFFGDAGTRAARVGSIVLALGAAGLAVLTSQWFAAVLLASLAFGNYRALKLDAAMKDAPIGPELEAGFALLARGDAMGARGIAALIAPRAKTDGDRARVGHLAAWGALLAGDAPAARAQLAAQPAGTAPDAYLEGRVRLATGDAAGAGTALMEALLDRGDDEIADALGDALEAAGDVGALTAVLEDPARAGALEPALARRAAARLTTAGLVEETSAAMAQHLAHREAQRAQRAEEQRAEDQRAAEEREPAPPS